MFSGKPIVINGGMGFGKLLADLVPKDPQPEAPQLPYQKKKPRSWVGAIVICTVGSAVLCLLVLPLLGLFIKALPVAVTAVLTFLFVSFLVYKLPTLNIQDEIQLTETELTITDQHVQWISRRPFTGVETRTVPLSEYEGIRFEVHEVTATQSRRMMHELYYVILVHPERDLCVNLYCGRTSQHILYMLQQWERLLPLPILEPNELAKERIEILANAERNRDKPFFLSQT